MAIESYVRGLVFYTYWSDWRVDFQQIISEYSTKILLGKVKFAAMFVV